MQRRRFVAHLGSGLAALTLGGAARPATRKPNIVLIYADDVGYGDLSCYGASQVHTPNLDKLAGSGVRFTNVHASSATCTPSRYSLMTGEYAWRKPGTAILPGDAALIVNPGRPTLPSMLKQQGYATGAVGKWHLGLGNGNIDWNGDIQPGPNEIGFDYSFIIPATGDRVPCVFVENHRVANLDPKDPIRVSYTTPFPGEPTGKANPELLKMHPSHGHDQAIVNGISRIGYMTGGKSALWVDENIADVLTAKATGFIEKNKTNPFFLYFATHDIHVPRVPNPRFAGQTNMGPRGDAIAELDWTVGQVLAALDRHRLTDHTILMFSSDNGPVVDDGYRDQAVEKLGAHKPAGPLRGGKYSNFDGGTRVPFMLRWPGEPAGRGGVLNESQKNRTLPRRVAGGFTGVKPDSVSHALISQVDLLSSFASLTGARLTDDAAPDSVNVLPALLGQSKTARASLVEHAGALSLIEGDWKLIAPGQGPRLNQNTNTELGNDSEPQLYNLATDLAERTNLAAQYPERVAAMTATLDRIRTGRQPR